MIIYTLHLYGVHLPNDTLSNSIWKHSVFAYRKRERYCFNRFCFEMARQITLSIELNWQPELARYFITEPNRSQVVTFWFSTRCHMSWKSKSNCVSTVHYPRFFYVFSLRSSFKSTQSCQTTVDVWPKNPNFPRKQIMAKNSQTAQQKILLDINTGCWVFHTQYSPSRVGAAWPCWALWLLAEAGTITFILISDQIVDHCSKIDLRSYQDHMAVKWSKIRSDLFI
jgi:hypothetical protein